MNRVYVRVSSVRTMQYERKPTLHSVYFIGHCCLFKLSLNENERQGLKKKKKKKEGLGTLFTTEILHNSALVSLLFIWTSRHCCMVAVNGAARAWPALLHSLASVVIHSGRWNVATCLSLLCIFCTPTPSFLRVCFSVLLSDKCLYWTIYYNQNVLCEG